MKNTKLVEKHLALGAKMVPFAGFNMPLQYEGLKAEHQHVRQNLGVFDVSHMGQIFVQGPNAEAFLQKVTSNDVAKLQPGKVQYSCLPNHTGGIVDDLLVYCLAKEQFLLVVNASNIEKDLSWLQSHQIEGALILNESDNWSLLAVQGPKAAEAMQELTEVDLSQMKYYTFKQGTFAEKKDVIISATGYTGAGGFELYVKNKDANHLWEEVLRAGAKVDIKPIGLAARDTLRLEMGFCLYGNDIDDSTSPLEAGLGWITKFNKDFINAPALKAQKEKGVDQKLVGFIMEDRGIPRKDYLIKNKDGYEIGRVTSGTQSPSMGQAIGLGYVTVNYATPDSEIYVVVRNKALKARVTKPPFYRA
jgi:aminomethyltransferase